MVARSQDVNISYSVTNKKRQNRKRKRTSLVVDPETHTTLDPNGPPDKAKDIRAAKRARRRGKELINSMVEVEYKGKKRRWKLFLSGMVEGYHRSLQLPSGLPCSIPEPV